MQNQKCKEIFVFGSNLAGRHGKGAALYARNNHGAIYGNGAGLQNCSFAIPTKDVNLKTLSLNIIKKYVKEFIKFAKNNNELIFNVTNIGCGLAGYTPKDIAPLFVGYPDNVKLSKEFLEVLNGKTDQ